MVKVKVEHRKYVGVTARPSDGLCHRVDEYAPIGKISQAVVPCHLQDLRFSLLTVADVAHRRQHDLTTAKCGQSNRNLCPEKVSILRLAVPLGDLRPVGAGLRE